MNDLRSLQRLATSPDFEAAYDGATQEQRRIVTRLIGDGDKEAVEQWLAIQERDSLIVEELTVKELRRLAASLGIAGYQFMAKASLLSAIRSKELPP